MNSPSSILDPGRPVARGRRRPPPLADSILGAIGNTPLVELRQIVRRRGLDGRILAKLVFVLNDSVSPERAENSGDSNAPFPKALPAVREDG